MGWFDGVETCPTCGGKGEVISNPCPQNDGDDWLRSGPFKCPSCDGWGKVKNVTRYNEWIGCRRCDSTGWITFTKYPVDARGKMRTELPPIKSWEEKCPDCGGKGVRNIERVKGSPAGP